MSLGGNSNDIISMSGITSVSDGLVSISEGDITFSDDTVLNSTSDIAFKSEANTFFDETTMNANLNMYNNTEIMYKNQTLDDRFQGIDDGNFTSMSIENNLEVLGDVSFNSELFVNADVSLNSNLFVNDNTVLNSTLSVVDDVSFNSNLFVNADVSLNSNLFVNDNTVLNSTLSVVDDVSFNSNLFVNADVSGNSNLFIGGDASLNSNLFINSIMSVNGIGDSNKENNLSQLSSNRLSFRRGTGDGTNNDDGSISVNKFSKALEFVGHRATDENGVSNRRIQMWGHVKLNDTLYVTNSTILKNTLNVDGVVTLNSNLFVNGDISGESLFVGGDISGNSNLFVNGDISGESLFVNGDVSFNNNLQIEGDLSAKGHVHKFGHRYVTNPDTSIVIDSNNHAGGEGHGGNSNLYLAELWNSVSSFAGFRFQSRGLDDTFTLSGCHPQVNSGVPIEYMKIIRDGSTINFTGTVEVSDNIEVENRLRARELVVYNNADADTILVVFCKNTNPEGKMAEIKIGENNNYYGFVRYHERTNIFAIGSYEHNSGQDPIIHNFIETQRTGGNLKIFPYPGNDLVIKTGLANYTTIEGKGVEVDGFLTCGMGSATFSKLSDKSQIFSDCLRFKRGSGVGGNNDDGTISISKHSSSALEFVGQYEEKDGVTKRRIKMWGDTEMVNGLTVAGDFLTKGDVTIEGVLRGDNALLNIGLSAEIEGSLVVNDDVEVIGTLELNRIKNNVFSDIVTDQSLKNSQALSANNWYRIATCGDNTTGKITCSFAESGIGKHHAYEINFNSMYWEESTLTLLNSGEYGNGGIQSIRLLRSNAWGAYPGVFLEVYVTSNISTNQLRFYFSHTIGEDNVIKADFTAGSHPSTHQALTLNLKDNTMGFVRSKGYGSSVTYISNMASNWGDLTITGGIKPLIDPDDITSDMVGYTKNSLAGGNGFVTMSNNVNTGLESIVLTRGVWLISVLYELKTTAGAPGTIYYVKCGLTTGPSTSMNFIGPLVHVNTTNQNVTNNMMILRKNMSGTVNNTSTTTETYFFNGVVGTNSITGLAMKATIYATRLA